MLFPKVSAITNDIRVDVAVLYQPQHSKPANSEYIFAYQITLINNGHYTCQLLRRRWSIFDSNNEYKEIEGDGVVGEQPILNNGEKFTYNSFVKLTTELGTMKGSYTFIRQVDGLSFEVEIPEFKLEVPTRLN